MGKALYIAEKPSVTAQFVDALDANVSNHNGYKESADAVFTWCVGHLVTMSYPEAYDSSLKRWQLDTLPFLPAEFKYEVIGSVSEQFKIVSSLLNRDDVDTIYVCTDSGREGEYIYRLVDQMANVPDTKSKKRVWINSQTKDEILRGIREAKDISEYDNVAASAYLRAKEDYLMGINFSRVLSLKFGYELRQKLGEQKGSAIAIGRVMTCVLGMVVRREREIRDFVETPFYRVLSNSNVDGVSIDAEWKAVPGSRYENAPELYKENGFKKREDAEKLAEYLCGQPLTFDEESKAEFPCTAIIDKLEKKTEKKNPPLLYNLAELQNDCSKMFKINPDQTLEIIQELYEKKLCTYPRTDARVLSTAVAKEIGKNLGGISSLPEYRDYCSKIMELGSYKTIAKTKYTDDSKITDHYAIIPTGQGLSALKSLGELQSKVYETIVRRFLAIFFPPAEYKKIALTLDIQGEKLTANFKMLDKPGYLEVMKYSFFKDRQDEPKKSGSEEEEEVVAGADSMKYLESLKKGMEFAVDGFSIKEGKTSSPKRYNSGSMILAMENAGQLIEDEELRSQIKGSGIGTSATRAGIITKLCNISYLSLNKKTQILTPTLKGEIIYDIVCYSMKQMLNAELTASWEKGLTQVAEGTITESEYLDKLKAFISKRTDNVKVLRNTGVIEASYRQVAQYYKVSGKK